MERRYKKSSISGTKMKNKTEKWEQEFKEISDRLPSYYNGNDTLLLVEIIGKLKIFISKTRNQAQIEILEKLDSLEEEPSKLLFFGKSYRLGRKEIVKEIKAAAKIQIKKLKEENEQSEQKVTSGDGEG